MLQEMKVVGKLAYSKAITHKYHEALEVAKQANGRLLQQIRQQYNRKGTNYVMKK